MRLGNYGITAVWLCGYTVLGRNGRSETSPLFAFLGMVNKEVGVYGSRELKALLSTKGDTNYFIGPSVDENGILDILNYFFS